MHHSGRSWWQAWGSVSICQGVPQPGLQCVAGVVTASLLSTGAPGFRGPVGCQPNLCWALIATRESTSLTLSQPVPSLHQVFAWKMVTPTSELESWEHTPHGPWLLILVFPCTFYPCHPGCPGPGFPPGPTLQLWLQWILFPCAVALLF